jgi:hypothetical protein
MEADVAVPDQRQALFRDGRPADVATQPLELLALIRPRSHTGVQREPCDLADLVIEGLITRPQRLQRKRHATMLRPESDTVGDRRTEALSDRPSFEVVANQASVLRVAFQRSLVLEAAANTPCEGLSKSGQLGTGRCLHATKAQRTIRGCNEGG